MYLRIKFEGVLNCYHVRIFKFYQAVIMYAHLFVVTMFSDSYRNTFKWNEVGAQKMLNICLRRLKCL